MASKVKFGLTLSNRGILLGLTSAGEILEMAERAESSGAFEHVWVGDSIMAKPRMESVTLMAGIAARTKQVKIANNVFTLNGEEPKPVVVKRTEGLKSDVE